MRRLIPVLTGALALAVSLIVLSAGARTQTGVPVFPLDDSYIHLQYGWQAAQGEWLQYNAGAAPTSGATSLLYMLLLAAGFAAGISQSAMPAVLLGLNMTAFVLSAALTAQMAGRLADCLNDDRMPPERFALFGGMLFAGSGWMAWAALSGMETMLLVLFVTLTLWGVLAENATVRSIGLFLATLTRPETVLLGGVVALSELLPEGDERWLDRLPRAVLAGLPALGVLASPILNWIVTGSPGSTGLLAKTRFTLVPFFPGEVITAIANIIAELFVWLLGGPTETRGWIVLPLGQIIAAIGVLLLWRTHRPLSRRLVVVTAGWVVLGVLATATLQTATWHNYRYQMPLYPALILLMTAGLIGLIGWIAHRSGRLPIRVVYYGALVFALGWAVWSVSTFRSAYARDTTTALTMQIRMANWLQANTNPDALVAVHDVGIMRFYGERPTLDVVGLTSDGMVEAHRNGPGTLYEALETARVDYYAVYPQQAPPYFGIEAAADLFGETLLRIEEPGCSDVTNADCVKAITQPDWDGLACSAAPAAFHHRPHRGLGSDGYV
ncbi:MAG: hypothetical protein GYB64_12440 [Chloroflexi bacterium]|nr:hypothetical protein [Chloroflexota bacterium]